MQKSLLIFDLDGTLIDSVPDIALAINMMLGKISGLPVAEDKVRGWVGNGSVKLVERALIDQVLPHDESHLHIAHELFLNAYAHDTCTHTVAYVGVHDGLTRLKAYGYRLAICTNKPVQFLPEIMRNMDWQDLFEMILGGDSLAVKKPNPAPLLHICQQLGIDPSMAVMIGDSKNDVQAGKNAGITTLALTYGYNYDEPITNSQPDRAFDDFKALADYLCDGNGSNKA
ncbi:MAG: phosphoglycolate phosphatase [Moraxella sp.]|nr:phosphoglycolate phosphatase [Moraxella sp.]